MSSHAPVSIHSPSIRSLRSVAVAANSVVLVGQARRERVEHLQLQRRNAAQDRLEVARGDHKHSRRLRRRDRRSARRAGDERDLAEEVAGAERVHLAALALHVGGALDDDEELLARCALARELPALLDRELVGDGRDLVQLPLRAVLEQRHALEQLDFCVLSQHGPILRAAATPGQPGRGTVVRVARDTDALIIDAVRSPIGKKNGTLSHIRGDDLSAQVINGLVARNDVDPGEIEDLQWGVVTQINEQTWNIGRNVALAAGWPVTVCGTTVDRQCGSSMQTNFNAAAAIWSGQLDLVLSGGGD